MRIFVSILMCAFIPIANGCKLVKSGSEVAANEPMHWLDDPKIVDLIRSQKSYWQDIRNIMPEIDATVTTYTGSQITTRSLVGFVRHYKAQTYIELNGYSRDSIDKWKVFPFPEKNLDWTYGTYESDYAKILNLLNVMILLSPKSPLPIEVYRGFKSSFQEEWIERPKQISSTSFSESVARRYSGFAFTTLRLPAGYPLLFVNAILRQREDVEVEALLPAFVLGPDNSFTIAEFGSEELRDSERSSTRSFRAIPIGSSIYDSERDGPFDEWESSYRKKVCSAVSGFSYLEKFCRLLGILPSTQRREG